MVSLLRQARMFHPRGSVFRARVVVDPDTQWVQAARRLEGHALVRLSGALFKAEVQHLEVLGAAIRISSSRIESEAPSPGDQDLLLATILSPLTMPLAPFSTRSGDYLANCYYGVAPFELTDVGRVKLRMRPRHHRAPTEEDRREAIETAVRDGEASFVLEARPTLRFGWGPLARIELESAASDVDQEALRFDPFRDGRGARPVGFVHAIRKAVYLASQAARPRRIT